MLEGMATAAALTGVWMGPRCVALKPLNSDTKSLKSNASFFTETLLNM
jgi:hypothetical protein